VDSSCERSDSECSGLRKVIASTTVTGPLQRRVSEKKIEPRSCQLISGYITSTEAGARSGD